MTRKTRISRVNRPMSPAMPLLESLEPRALMDGSADPVFTFTARFPEGFASDSVSEYVPITNPNPFPVRYELHARYENGGRDQLVASGIIGPGQRGGATLTIAGTPLDDRLVRSNTPYALVLNATAQLAASFSHYDNSASIGESFTSDLSTEWSFSDGYKSHGGTRDYILIYNPSDEDANVTLTVYGAGGVTHSETKHVSGQRRAGWSIDDATGIPEGAYAVKLTSTRPIVASQSRYELGTGRGYGVLGLKDPSTVGVMMNLESEDSPHGGGDDSFHHGHDSFIAILNANASTAQVTFTFISRDDHGGRDDRRDDDSDPTDIGGPSGPYTITVPAHSRFTLDLNSLGFTPDSEFGALYRSDLAITVMSSTYQGRDATGVEAATYASPSWVFGEGYMSRLRADRGVTEDVYLFNPTATDISVHVTFIFASGGEVTITKSLSPREIEDVKVHRLTEVLSVAPDVWYGVRVQASGPVVAALEHWDDYHAGGFGGLGIATGPRTLLDQLL